MEGILFLCIANSCRSQMAEGLARNIMGPDVLIRSAGSEPTRVAPEAIKVMAEVGIDISKQQAKSVQDIDLSELDLAITLCADEVCPLLPPGIKHLHWPIRDPAMDREEKDVRDAFREARDTLQQRIEELRTTAP